MDLDIDYDIAVDAILSRGENANRIDPYVPYERGDDILSDLLTRLMDIIGDIGDSCFNNDAAV